MVQKLLPTLVASVFKVQRDHWITIGLTRNSDKLLAVMPWRLTPEQTPPFQAGTRKWESVLGDTMKGSKGSSSLLAAYIVGSSLRLRTLNDVFCSKTLFTIHHIKAYGISLF